MLYATSAVVGLTALGAVAGALVPALAGAVRPHAALKGDVSDALGILGENGVALSVPFALWALRLPSTGLGRRFGDALVLFIVLRNTISVGIELGRWRDQLLPYIPQLPLEWAALSVATAAWLLTRNGCPNRRSIACLAVALLLLLAAAAAAETWCTPHRDAPSDARAAVVPATRSWVTAVDLAPDFAPTADVTLQGRLRLSSPHQGSAPLVRSVGAARAHNNHRPLQGGIT
jgi:hypothetical protein